MHWKSTNMSQKNQLLVNYLGIIWILLHSFNYFIFLITLFLFSLSFDGTCTKNKLNERNAGEL